MKNKNFFAFKQDLSPRNDERVLFLLELAKKGGIALPLNFIATILDIDRSHASKIMAKLEKRELVEKRTIQKATYFSKNNDSSPWGCKC